MAPHAGSNVTKVEIKTVPHKLVVLFDYGRIALPPILGLGSFIAYIQTIDLSGKPIIAIVGSIIIAWFTYLGIKATARTRVEVKEIETTQTADVDKAKLLLELFDKAAGELEKARQHFAAELKEQRSDFFNKEQENLDRFIAKEQETREHYEKREDEHRQNFHTRLGEANTTVAKYITRCTKIETQLKTMGINVTEDCEIILPDSFERRRN